MFLSALILSAMALSDAYSGKNAVNHAKSRAPFFNQYFPLFVVQVRFHLRDIVQFF